MKITPKKPHFLKPMRPGFKQGIKIPRSFLIKYMKRHNHYEHAILKRADKKWQVKVNNGLFESDWEKFVEQHDLQLGDILVFKHEENMDFKVSIFDLYQECEREYEEEELKAQNVEEISQKFESKESATPKACSHFVLTVKPHCLSMDVLNIPKKFALANGLFNVKKLDLIVIDERQRSWPVILRSYGNCVYLRGGWNKIRDANCLKEGDHITFEVVTGGEKSVWQFHNKPNHDIKSSSKTFPHPETSIHKPLDHSQFVCTVRPYSLSRDALLIPKQFALANGLFNFKECNLIVRSDETQRSWNVMLRSYSNKDLYLTNGWNEIRDANHLKEGDHILFEVVTNGNEPIWKFHGKDAASFKRLTEG
ncbi:B3 domain-containing protein REM10 [Capsicum annuum]|uniref:B3 domain-containing protein REM10 n=1 Tax=Capsicum annuum TaxID=4072 RepID=UPI001FB0DF32|nr:B3 domain-containing protein REM10 [Capsicum annuum]